MYPSFSLAQASLDAPGTVGARSSSRMVPTAAASSSSTPSGSSSTSRNVSVGGSSMPSLVSAMAIDAVVSPAGIVSRAAVAV